MAKNFKAEYTYWLSVVLNIFDNCKHLSLKNILCESTSGACKNYYVDPALFISE